jgi:hypothetical protein
MFELQKVELYGKAKSPLLAHRAPMVHYLNKNSKSRE